MSKEIKVALQHSYLKDRRENDKPDRLTRVGILAALEMYRRGEIDKICLTVIPELSDPQVARYRMLLKRGLNQEDLVVEPETTSTAGEIEKFKELAEKHGWTKLISIGNRVHIKRIEKEVKEIFKDREVEVLSTDSILSEYSRYQPILEDMDNWPEQKSLALQEMILNTPVIGETLLKSEPFISKYKIALQTWVFKQIEGRFNK